MGSGGNSVGYNLHRKKTGDGGTVGGAAANIRCKRKGDRLRGERAQEGHMVAPRGEGDTAQGHPGLNLVGINEGRQGERNTQ